MTIAKHRDICGLVGTLCGACIVTLVALGFGAAPARAQTFTQLPLPPQVKFIGNGKYTGTLQIQGLTLPITGKLIYLTGDITYLQISVDTAGQITSNTWLTAVIPTVINEWETVSTFPGTCRKEVLSGASYPQCTTWTRTPRGLYVLACTVTAQGNTTTLNFTVQLSSDFKLVQMKETATITGENDNSQGNESDMTVSNSILITMTEQSNTPPVPSDFNRPSICNAPTGNSQSQNDNSQGNENELGCTGTIPNICF